MESARLSRPTWRWRDFKKSFSGLSRPSRKRRDFRDHGGYGATGLASATKKCYFNTFATEVETARLSRPRRRWRDQESFHRDQGGDDATFQTKAETARPFRSRRRRRNFSNRGGDGATKIIFLMTEVDTVQLSRQRRRRRDF